MNTTTIRRFTRSRRHQLSRLARPGALMPVTPQRHLGWGQSVGTATNCDALRKRHSDLRRAKDYYEGLQKDAESEVTAQQRERELLYGDLDAAASELAEARSRSIEPPDFVVVCPGDASKMPSPGRRPNRKRSREEIEQSIQDGTCRIVSTAAGRKSRENWRRDLDAQKKQDIARLEDELRSIRQRITATHSKEGKAKADAENHKGSVGRFAIELGGVEDSYRASGCGHPNRLWD